MAAQRATKTVRPCAWGRVFQDLRPLAADRIQVSKHKDYKYKFKGNASQGFVPVFVSHRLLRQTSELEKELNSANAKLSRIMKSMQQLKNASGKTTQ